MTAAQFKLYRAALTIGRHFGTGGAVWTYVQPSGDGITADRTLTNRGQRTLYVVRNFMDKERSSLAQSQVFAADWLGIGNPDLDIAAEGVLISVADTSQVFSATGTPATDQGFTLIPLAPAKSPL